VFQELSVFKVPMKSQIFICLEARISVIEVCSNIKLSILKRISKIRKNILSLYE